MYIVKGRLRSRWLCSAVISMPRACELRHDRVDLFLGQDQIAHDHALIAHLLEGEPAAERKAGFERDAVERDLQIGARQTDPIDAARHRRTGLSERLADLRLPAVIGRQGEPGAFRRGQQQRQVFAY